MAFDEWMLIAAASRPGALLARLYTWQTGAITFGFNQRRDTALNFDEAGETTVLRRITGGRAVYHDMSELTYAFAFHTQSPPSEALAGSTAASSGMLARVLSVFLAGCGVEADWVRTSSADNSRPEFFHKAACFASHARYELVSDGAKVVASARRDWNGASLQHGSIKLQGLAGHRALKMDTNSRHTGLESIDLTRLNELAGAFSRAISEVLGVTVCAAELAAQESQMVSERVTLVQRQSLERRDLIAQTGTQKSL